MTADDHVDITVVVPVYKEEATVCPFLARLEPLRQALGGERVRGDADHQGAGDQRCSPRPCAVPGPEVLLGRLLR